MMPVIIDDAGPHTEPALKPIADGLRTAIYEIFIDRYAGTGGGPLALPPPGHSASQHHCGGSLEGVAARLDHVQALGADAVYLTPVFRAESNHKYDTGSYDEIDPRFGGEAAFDVLAAECRRRGMGLILDGVFNHVGVEHDWFVRAQKDEDKTRFKFNGRPHHYACWRGHHSLPELNLRSTDVQQELFDGEEAVIRRWIRRGATGWRLDCANDMGLDACGRATKAARMENAPDGVIGEVMTYAEDWVEDGSLDGIMNYYFRETVLGLAQGDVHVAQAAYNFKRMARRYGRSALLRSWNILSSHDTPRLATLVPEFERRSLAQVLAFVFPGIPMIYYGEEIGMLGGADPDCRNPMQWDESQWDHKNLDLLRRLTGLKSSQAALRTGDYLPMPQPGHPTVLAFARTTDVPREVVVVLANCSDEPFTGKVFAPYSHMFDGLILTDLLENTDPVKVSAGSLAIQLPPWGIALYAPDDSVPGYSFFQATGG